MSGFGGSGADGSGKRRLRSLSLPRPIHVRSDPDGAPAFVRLPGKPARRVAAVRERWRIDDEWWRDEVSREYFAVVLEHGDQLVVYLDLIAREWFAQR